jgi:segregation and condensation protein B
LRTIESFRSTKDTAGFIANIKNSNSAGRIGGMTGGLSRLAAVLESLLFASECPLSLTKLTDSFPGQTAEEWRQAAEELHTHYDRYGHSMFLAEIGGGYQLRTRVDYGPWIVQLRPASPQRLSQAALETLAVIAYKQPLIRAEIETIRGVDASGVLRQLLEKGLIQMLGRKDVPGRPILYGTTARFLEVFALRDLKSLPTQEELQALVASELTGDQEPQGPADLPQTTEQDEQQDETSGHSLL